MIQKHSLTKTTPSDTIKGRGGRDRISAEGNDNKISI